MDAIDLSGGAAQNSGTGATPATAEMMRALFARIQRLEQQLQQWTATLAAEAPRPRMKWLEWSGDMETLSSWQAYIRAKLRNDAATLPDAEGVVMMIQQMIPTSQQAHTARWIQSESARELADGEVRWSAEAFLAHIAERCGDPRPRTWPFGSSP